MRPNEPSIGSSELTRAQNERLKGIEAALAASVDGLDGGARGGASPAKKKKAEEERLARNHQFDSGLYAVERILSQFVCPTTVVPPPQARQAESGASGVEGGSSGGGSFGSGICLEGGPTASEVRRRQREASERLFSGSSFQSKGMTNKPILPPRQKIEPPLKKLDRKLNALRDDAAAREALRARVAQHLIDMQEERRRRCGGEAPRNFILENVRTANRPRSAPPHVALLAPGDPEPIDLRPAFRPGGAPAEIYKRPGSPPKTYGYDKPPSQRGRPQSALVRSPHKPLRPILRNRPASAQPPSASSPVRSPHDSPTRSPVPAGASGAVAVPPLA
jgi:hypothetical protein